MMSLCSSNSCNRNLSSNNPVSQYQRLKIIQNTVRVYSSLYTMNLSSLNAYHPPLKIPQIVVQNGTPYVVPAFINWNQMSDRASPSKQVIHTGSGSTYGASSTRHTIVSDRPGAMSPGGVGVDIKHNSYDRYLNRIKARKPLRRGVIPPTFGLPIVFDCADPIYGGKTVKTAIINCSPNGCVKTKDDVVLYKNELNALPNVLQNINTVYPKSINVKKKCINKNVMETLIELKNTNNYNYGIDLCRLIEASFIQEIE